MTARRPGRSIASWAVVQATSSQFVSLFTVQQGLSTNSSSAFPGSRDGAFAIRSRQRCRQGVAPGDARREGAGT